MPSSRARKSRGASGGRRPNPGAGRKRRGVKLFEQALKAHRDGRIADAESAYREVLAVDPQHAGALHHLGILAQQRGDVGASVRLLGQAVGIDPSDPLLQNNFGNALRSMGNDVAALEAYRAAVASDEGYVNALYNLADLLQERGEHAESEAGYRRVVALAPSDVGAWMGLGMVLLAQGRDDDALACFERAVSLRPEDPVCHYNLGNALRSVERMDEAAREFRQAVAIAPDYAEAHHNLGMVLRSLGDEAAAESQFREALHYRPEYAIACVSLASMLYAREEYDEAEELCRRALAVDPDAVRALCQLAHVLHAQDRPGEALQALRKAQALEPDEIDTRLHIAELLIEVDHANDAADIIEKVIDEQPLHLAAHCALSKAYTRAHRTAAAVDACRKAISLDADCADAHSTMGLALRQGGDTAGAIEAFEAAIRIEPDFAEAYNNLGLVYIDAGDMHQAMEYYRKALELDPRLAASSLNMSRARRFGESDLPEIARIESLLDDDGLTDDGRTNLHFALGKMYDDCGLYDQAFAHFVEGNRYKRKRVRFDSDRFALWSAKFTQVFTPEFFDAHVGMGEDSERPVFIVGMPRSGTTLVEQILASHSRVHGADELTTVFDTICELEKRVAGGSEYPDNVPALDASDYRWAAGQYLEKLRTLDDEAARVTDKMPTNFFHLGFIAVMLPGARIIHCRRDPMDVCLSIFVQLFTEGHYYSYDLSDIATYYRGYEQTMAHWRDVLPIPMYEVRYEELVDDQERVSRELVDYLGLEWDERCLEFYQTKRAVRTASNWQVRQPIYKTARKRWRNYESQLARLKAELHYVDDE